MCSVTQYLHCVFLFLGHRECRLDPPVMNIMIAREQMTEAVPFDQEYSQALDELIRHADMEYPPPTVIEADAMYLELRDQMHAIVN